MNKKRGGKILIQWVLVLIILVMECNCLINFEFKCNSNNNSPATLTSYSYVKEPRLYETGYTRGLKTGSFNYLANGNIAEYTEKYNYDYGNGTNITDSYVSHSLLIDFSGEKSISEFYGKGFFGNNRAISAWKKIRYEDLTRNRSPYGVRYANEPNSENYMLGDTRMANDINVDARVTMDSNNTFFSYDFNYVADIKDGVFESKDSAGWSNKTGARRLDLEQESLISGDDFTVHNVLSESGPFQVASVPIVDWLPCCFSITKPSIEGLDSAWPTEVVKRTLEADKLLPRYKQYLDCPRCSESLGDNCSQECLKSIKDCSANGSDCFKGCSDKCTKSLKENSAIDCPTTCTPEGNCISKCTPRYVEEKCDAQGCSGYECIYTYDEDFPAVRKSVRIVGEEKNINLTATYCRNELTKYQEEFAKGVPKEAKFTWYLIGLINNGEVALDSVLLSVTLPKGMLFKNSSYRDEKAGTLEVESQVPEVYDETRETKLTWKIGTMTVGRQINIKLGAFDKTEARVDISSIRTEVSGRAPDNTGVSMSLDNTKQATQAECDLLVPGKTSGAQPQGASGGLV